MKFYKSQRSGDPVPTQEVGKNHYYPFDMNQEGLWAQPFELDEQGEILLDADGNRVVDQVRLDKYQYNGKELNTDFDVNWLDYGARWYDPSVVRWNAVDNLAEKFISFSPYHYAGNNPILLVDYDGNDYGIYIDHQDHTITIRATFISQTKDSELLDQAVEYWNSQNGKFVFSVGEGVDAVSYAINFELSTEVDDAASSTGTETAQSKILTHGSERVDQSRQDAQMS